MISMNCINEDFLAVIPPNAIEVNVTNIVNPYTIYFHQLKDYKKKLQRIYSKIQNYMTHWHKKYRISANMLHDYIPEVGDHVILCQSKMSGPNLPSQMCRGIVTRHTSKDADIFLLDYGIVVAAIPIDALFKYKEHYFPEPPLIVSVAVDNILPVNVSNVKAPRNASCFNTEISGQWPKVVTDFMLSIMKTSKETYFHASAYNKENNIGYGDFFVNIENKNFSLREILIQKMFAVNFDNDLETALNNAETFSHTILGKTCNDAVQNNIHAKSKHTVIVSPDNVQNTTSNQFIGNKIMVHSPCKVIPLQHVSDARFAIEVHKKLDGNKIKNLCIIQSHMWAAIKQGLNVIAIGQKNCGKGLGYVPPIISYIVENEESLNNKQIGSTVTKPVALILCSSNEKVMQTAKKFKMLSNMHKVVTLEAYSGVHEETIMSYIINKCSIVVSSPSFLRRFLERKPNQLDLSELSFFVMDHADVILDKYLENDLSILIKKYKIFSKTRIYGINEKPMQFIATGREWSKTFHDFVSVLKSEYSMDEPYYCIGSHLEAAVYSGVKAKMLISKSCRKKHEVMVHLSNVNYRTKKSIIICQNFHEVNALCTFFNSYSIKVLVCHEDMVAAQIQDVKNEWLSCLSGNYPLLIVTDDVLSDINISDAECLVHYSVVLKYKSQFCKRFSVLMDNLLMGKSSKCDIFIIADETVERQFKGLIKIIQRLGVSEIPLEWLELSKGILYKLDIEKKKMPLCENVKMFGHCESASSCKFRHSILNEVDAPALDISKGDTVTIYTLNIHNAQKMSGRIIEINKKILKNNIIRLTDELQDYFEKEENRRCHKEVEVGDCCAYYNQETYFKVQILDIISVYSGPVEKPKEVMIKNWHNGKIMRVNVNSLREIPEEIVNIKTNVVDVYLLDFAPHDNEQIWSDMARVATKKWFDSSSTIFGKVAFHIGESIWLKDINIRQKIDGYPDLISSISLKTFLKNNDHGVDNAKHSFELEELIQNSNQRLEDISPYYTL